MGLKKLIEKRNDLAGQMRKMTETVTSETRAFTTEEDTNFKDLKRQVDELDKTIESVKEVQARALEEEKDPEEDPEDGEKKEETEKEKSRNKKRDIKVFASYIRSQVSPTLVTRADSNITKGDNGAVIPKTIANMIIDKVKEICPLFRDASQYNVKGTLAIPYVDSENDNITMAYADEFTDLEAKSTKLLTIDLTGYLAGVLTKVSKSLINNSDFDIVSFVVGKIAMAVTLFYEHEALIGTTGKATGLSTATTKITAAAATAITADEIIRLKDKLPSVYQMGAYFIMNPETLTAVRLLKDGNNRYLMNDDLTGEFTGKILGKDVHTSDQCPKLEAGKDAIYYVNPSIALATKLTEDMEIQVLTEKFATQHAIGIVCWSEIDCKIQNQQGVAALTMKAS